MFFRLCVSLSVSHTLRRAYQAQSRDLEAICDDAESGLMQEMVTITHNNRCAEMLATVRRGPFARSTQEERIEFLGSKKLTAMSRSPIMPWSIP